MPWNSASLGFRLVALAAASGAAVSCGSADEGDGSVDKSVLPAGTVSCAEDERIDTYTANLDKPGALGVLSFRFSDLTPAPPAKGANTFHVRVTDASGANMQGDLHVALTMPDHGHGTQVKPVVSFDAASGEYTVTPLYLFMAGVWRIEFDAYAGSADAPAATPLDRAVLYFCIEG